MSRRKNRRKSKPTLRFNEGSRRRRTIIESLETRQLLTGDTSPFGYLQIPLAADQSGAALVQDASLQNAWGVAALPNGGPVWVADGATGVASRYQGAVSSGGSISAFSQLPQNISVPAGAPTAITFNPTFEFTVGSGNTASPPLFFIASQNGEIDAWQSLLGTQAQKVIGVSGAEFTGLAVANNGTASFLYAADFHDDKIDVFDSSYNATTLSANAFTDSSLPAGYAPYNIQLISGQLYVTYALQDAAKETPVVGGGNGIIDIYNLDGTLAKTFASAGQLNVPDGLAMAPSGFGDFAGDLLVANSGNGEILAYNTSGVFQGALNDGPGSTSPIIIDGVRGLVFGNGSSAGDVTTLFYSAANGGHGQFGEILNAFDQSLAVVPTVVTATQGSSFSGTLATLRDSDSTLAASGFAAEIMWGDGTSSVATVVSNTDGGFNINGTHTYASAGTYQATVTASDTALNARTATATANVIDTSFSPAGVTFTTTEAQSFSGSVGTFADPSGIGNQYFANIDWGDGSTSAGTVALAAGGSGYSVTGSHTYTGGGSFAVTTTVLEEMTGSTTAGSSAIGTIASTAAVTDLNTLTAQATTFSATQGTSATVAVATFTDTYAAATAGIFSATIDWGDGTSTSAGSVTQSNGTFTVMGTHAFVENGSMSATVSISDTPGTASATAVSTATVADGNTLTAQALTFVTNPGQTFAGKVATFSDTNSLVLGSDFSAQIDWGDGSSSAGTVTAANGVLTVAGSHSYTAGGLSDAVDVTITENAHTTIAYPTATSTAVVPADDVTGTGETISATATSASSQQSLATFTKNAGNLADTFTATIDWGDGTSFTTGTVTADGSGGYDVLGSHTYSTPGAYTPDVIVYESTAGGSATPAAAIAATANVASPVVLSAATLTGPEHTATAFTVATFTDVDASAIAGDFTATIDWGDGSGSSAGSVTGSAGHFTVSGTHSFADAGTFSVGVSLSEATPTVLSNSVTSTATISQDDSFTPSAASLTATVGTAFSGVVATFTDTDTVSSSNAFTAVISWGDNNSSSAGTVTGANGVFTVSGVHTYSQDGSFPLTVTIENSSSLPGATESAATGSALVSPGSALSVTGTSITPTEGQTFSGTVATVTDTGSSLAASAFTATINWGDGTSSTATVTGASGSYTVAGSHTYTEEGTFQATVSVTETAISATVSATTSATVGEGDTLTAVAGTVTATQGSTFTGAVATFVDTNTGAAASDFTATIDWGDGSSTTAGSVTASNGTLAVSGSHDYSATGSDSIKVSLSDNSPGTASAAATSTATVVTTSTTTTSTATATISGEVFDDVNVNRVLDSGEIGLGGRTVFLNNDGTGVPDSSNPSTATDANGNYTFTALAAGSYSVMEVVPANHGVTLTTNPQTLSVTAGENVTGINIGNVLTSTLLPLQVPLTRLPAASDANTAYINAVYASILGHAPDATGLAYWQQQMTGGAGRASVAQGVWDSAEHRGMEVEQFYEEFLGRPSDPAGKSFWTAAFNAWGTEQIEVEGFLTSTEFMNLHSGETAFVDALYNNVALRAPDSTGESYWVGQLASGQTLLQVASAFVFGQEASTAVVDAFYSDFLHRAPDSADLQMWVNDLTSHTLNGEQVGVQILASGEYYSDMTGNHAPSITSANSTGFTTGSAGSFTITTTGSPTAAISESGALPSGVTLVDNHDGTATLAGTPAAGTAGTYRLTIKASNGTAPDASQTFTLTVS